MYLFAAVNIQDLLEMFMKWNVCWIFFISKVQFLFPGSRHLIKAGGEGLLMEIVMSLSLTGAQSFVTVIKNKLPEEVDG